MNTTTEILIIKTGALGDVLRTTSILPGLHALHGECRVTWVTAPAAVDLVRLHPRVDRVVALDARDEAQLEDVRVGLLDRRWERILSLDDEEPLCDLASSLVIAAGGTPGSGGVLSGAYLDAGGERRYTPDVGPWFDMGLLSVHGKEQADRLKLANRESHPQIYARMLGIEMGEPELHLPPELLAGAGEFAGRHDLHGKGPVIGLNTGAGGRWESKKLPVERTARLVEELNSRLEGRVSFLLLGGPEEHGRNRAILAEVGEGPHMVDAGTENPLFEFAALIDRLDLLVTSDSLALHMGVARGVPVVAFFAPTSAAEIELYGRGEKVASTAPDYCSYRRDADRSTLTVERLCDAILRSLG